MSKDLRDSMKQGTSVFDALLPATPGDPANVLRMSQEWVTQATCHCEACEPHSFGNPRMILCAICGNKRCPHATDHRNACTGSNEPGQKGSSYENAPKRGEPWPEPAQAAPDAWILEQDTRMAALDARIMDAAEKRLGQRPAQVSAPERRAYSYGVESAADELARLRAKCSRQRRELKRLNKYLGPYWDGYRNGLGREGEVRLRGIMNEAFGHKAVHAAEHAAIDAARGKP